MKFNATNIASFFLHKAQSSLKHELSNLKLQKLVYIAFGWHTVFGEHDLYQDPIEAWRYGPVLPSLYYKFSEFGDQPIQARTIEDTLHVYLPDRVGESLQFPLVIEKDSFIEGFLEIIFEQYIEMPPYKLVDLTHGKATPWDKVYIPGAKVEIPKTLIKDYYSKLA